MTYETLKANFLPFFVMGIILIGYYGVIFAIGFVLGMVTAQDPSLQPLEALFNLVNNVVSSFFGLGLSFCALEVIRT